MPTSQDRPLWDHHILICTNKRGPETNRVSCGDAGEALVDWFKQGIKERGLHVTMRANKSGCLEGCEAGPTVVIYPDAVWYSPRTEADVQRILDEHLVGGTVVADLLMDFAPLPAWQLREKKGRT